jgi:molybdopterin-guanine dinucleotide biosynthesis protein A
MRTAGVILAGGRSTRMGGRNKALVEIDGTTLLQYVLDRFSPQVDTVAINSNVPMPGQNLPVLRDATATFDGPLAGILAGLNWARSQGFDRLATVAVDTPFFPADLVHRLGAADPIRIALARSGMRNHPVFAMWPVAAGEKLHDFLKRGETRRVMSFLESYGYETVDFPADPFDPFFNVNTPEDLLKATEIHRALI